MGFLWLCRDPLMILTKFALPWNISQEVDVPRQGQIKISQLDNKTSLDLAISRIRTWGASSTTFFLELGEKYFSVVFELQKQSCQYLLCDRSIDEHNARYQAVGLQLARGDLKWLTRLGNPENEKTSQNESNRTRTTCDWWCERRQAPDAHQDQAVVDQVDHQGLLRMRLRRSSTMIRIMRG